MFHEGGLQSGIATAIQGNKSVVCFVTGENLQIYSRGDSHLTPASKVDGGELAHTWEQWLNGDDVGLDVENGRPVQTPTLHDLLPDKAVLLRIQANSQEAGFLSAFAPTTQIPCLVVIHNGQLQLRLIPDVDQRLFVTALREALLGRTLSARHGEAPAPGPCPADRSSLAPSPTPSNPQLTPSSEANLSPPATPLPEISTQRLPTTTTSHSNVDDTTPLQAPMPQEQAPAASVTPIPLDTRSTEAQDSARVRSLLQERGLRLEAERKKREEMEKAERIAKAKAKREAAEAAEAVEASSSRASSGRSAEASYAAQQAQRKREARKERERILKRIEDDKREREAKEEQRKAIAKAQAEDTGDSPAQDTAKSETDKVPAGSCAVQVRLFDGSTIRSRFPSTSTLRSDVRPWIDSERSNDDTPYTLKQILAPQPSRLIEISEEEFSLRELGLMPTATLVMVPVQGTVQAYRSNTPIGLIYKGISTGYGLASSVVGSVTGTLGSLVGMSGAVGSPQSAVPSGSQSGAENTTRPVSAGSGIRVRTLRDQEQGKDEQHFYNGNRLNFEPRRKDDDDGS